MILNYAGILSKKTQYQWQHFGKLQYILFKFTRSVTDNKMAQMPMSFAGIMLKDKGQLCTSTASIETAPTADSAIGWLFCLCSREGYWLGRYYGEFFWEGGEGGV